MVWLAPLFFTHPLDLLVVRARGDQALTKRAFKHNLKRALSVYEDIPIKTKIKWTKDKFPETWCFTPVCQEERRLLWKEELKNHPQPLKLIVLPPIKFEGGYFRAGGAEGICIEGVATTNLKRGERGRSRVLIAHELGHLLGATHTSTPLNIMSWPGLSKKLSLSEESRKEIAECVFERFF